MHETTAVDRIYEAALAPDRWPAVFQAIADGLGARGAVSMTVSGGGERWTASPAIEDVVGDFFAQGWHVRGGRADALIAEHHPGFRCETSYRSVEDLAAMPIYAEFLTPRGIVGGAGTVLQGARDDAVMFSLEGFADHDAASAAVPSLDALRPHLGRALSLAAQIEGRLARAVVDTLALGGVAAAVVDRDGRMRALNSGFDRFFDGRMSVSPRTRRVRFADPGMQEAVAAAGNAPPSVRSRSLPLPGGPDGDPAAAHLVPLEGAGRDLAGADGLLIVVADPCNAALPGADLLRLLFDLTPAEATLARALLEGRSLAEASRRAGVRVATSRSQLAAIFRKTGTGRQADLVRMLMGIAPLRAPDRAAVPMPPASPARRLSA